MLPRICRRLTSVPSNFVPLFPPLSSHLARLSPTPIPRTFLRGGHTILSLPRQMHILSNGETPVAPVPAPRPDYMRLEGTESPYQYRPGGLHPVAIGDLFADRYSITHKLGHGGYSTTWLAKDHRAGRYVAIKIAIAGSGLHETETLRELGASQPRDGQSAIPRVLDQFVILGPNGEHNATVMPPAMMSLADAKEGSDLRLFQLPVARAIAAQLARAVAFVHSCGIVHGDLHSGNVLLRLSASIDALSPEQLYERYRRPDPQAVRCADGSPIPKGVPTHCYIPVWLGHPSEDLPLSQARILLTDFGVSFDPAKNPRFCSHIPLHLTPPEVWFLPNEPMSFSSDIWSLGCTLWSIVAQTELFEGHWKEEVMEEQVEALGKFPPDWWERFEARGEWFDENGVRNDGYPARTWEGRFEDSVKEPRDEAGMETMGLEEKEAFLGLVRSMLTWCPKERITAEDVLKSEWMQKWAIPELKMVEG